MYIRSANSHGDRVYLTVGGSPLMHLTGSLSGVFHLVHAGIDPTHGNRSLDNCVTVMEGRAEILTSHALNFIY